MPHSVTLNREVVIGNKKIGPGNESFIIAEIGLNHNGNLKLAKELILAAKNCGCHAVKLQTFEADKLVSKLATKANYQKKNLKDSNNSQFNMLKKLELSKSDHHDLIKYCNSKKIKFFSTAFDTDSLDFLNSLNLDFF